MSSYWTAGVGGLIDGFNNPYILKLLFPGRVGLLVAHNAERLAEGTRFWGYLPIATNRASLKKSKCRKGLPKRRPFRHF